MVNKNIKKEEGFTLLIAIVVTSMMLIVSFVVSNIALKQLIIASANEQSQYAFYAADSGIECASYWDLSDTDLSPFATATPGTISCNNQTIKTGSQVLPLAGAPQSLVGGGGVLFATSTFYVTYPSGCAVVSVGKRPDGYTTIDSRGYNNCDLNSLRRFERGVSLTYENKPNSDSIRKATLLKLQTALEAYKVANTVYPSTGVTWKSSEVGDPVYDVNWIPDNFVPTYMPSYPHDPRGEEISQIVAGNCNSSNSHPAYQYRSDGADYKLISNCSSENGYSPTDTFYDPHRPNSAWQVNSNALNTQNW